MSCQFKLYQKFAAAMLALLVAFWVPLAPAATASATVGEYPVDSAPPEAVEADPEDGAAEFEVIVSSEALEVGQGTGLISARPTPM